MLSGHAFTKSLHHDTYPAIHSACANLSGRSVLITGASKGLGRAISLAYARAGASHIALAARSDLTAISLEVHEAAKAASRPAPQVLTLKLDVKDENSVAEAAAQVEKHFSRLDILINNAGVLEMPKNLVDSDPETWWGTWTANVRGPYLVTRAFIPLLLKGGDKQIINMGSVGALLIFPGFSAYQTTKLALLRFTEFTSTEYRDQGILTYCVHPGNVLTDIVGGGPTPEDIKHRTGSLLPSRIESR